MFKPSLFTATLLSILLTSAAHSQDLPPPTQSVTKKSLGIQISALGGYIGSLSGAISVSGLNYGGRVGYRLNPQWEIGLGTLAFTGTTSVTPLPPFSSFTLSNSLTLVGADLNFYFGNPIHPLYLGALTGLGMSSNSGNSVIFGLRLGYSFEIGRNFSVGPLFQFIELIAVNNSSLVQSLIVLSYSL